MSDHFEYVHFLPWKGDNFSTEHPRLLVLGESHYSDRQEGRDFTRHLTRDYISGAFNHRFWTQIAQAISGNPHSEIDRASFWNTIAFYNFVQSVAAEGPREAPTVEMFSRSEKAFFEVIDYLTPSHVLVLGNRLWDHLPDSEYEDMRFEPDGEQQLGKYRRSWGEVLAMPIHHPSSGFSAPRWHPVIQKFLAMK